MEVGTLEREGERERERERERKWERMRTGLKQVWASGSAFLGVEGGCLGTWGSLFIGEFKR